ncbi:hypothetical protein EDB86DRAFT_3087802 [Lactarius hatsudake]|nr:hypothetical protein EDB86DRAFT_3087802 [Lactarius hatsudake]
MLFLHPRQSDSPSSSPFSFSIPLTLSSSDTTSPFSTSSETRTDSTTTRTTSNASSSFTSTPTPTSTSTSTSDTSSSSSSSSSSRDTSTLSSSSHSTSSTTTPPPSSSSSTPTVSSTSSSDFFLSTLTTSFVTNINGVPTTASPSLPFPLSGIVTPIVTSLHGSTPVQASSRTAVIAGSAIGGLVLFIIGLSAIFILRRRVRRQRYWALSRKRLPSRSTFLAGESMDLPQSSPPFAYADTDDPFATRISRHPSGGSGSVDAPSFPYAYAYSHESDIPHVPSSPPRLFRPRASESGSIFQESVWPPPSAASQLTDPLTSPSHAVDLGSIVNEVMGRPEDGGGGGGRGRAREESGASEMGPLLDADDAVPTLTLTNPDPQSPLSPLQPPQTPPRPPRWLSRSPNPSPKSSPLHIARAL